MLAPKYCDYRQAPLYMALCFHFVVLQFVLNFILQKSNMEIYLTEGVCQESAVLSWSGVGFISHLAMRRWAGENQ